MIRTDRRISISFTVLAILARAGAMPVAKLLTLSLPALAVTLAVVLAVLQPVQAHEGTPNLPATGIPDIEGIPQVGQTLTVATSSIEDANGLVDTTFAFQWLRTDGGVDAEITGATSTDYTLVEADEDRAIKVRVSFADDDGHEEAVTSDPTAEVASETATVPEAPENVTVTSSNPGEVEVSWDAPSSDGDSAIFEYRVQWKRTSYSWGSSRASEGVATGTSHTISGLRASGFLSSSIYTVRVVAVNSVGDGPASSEALAIPMRDGDQPSTPNTPATGVPVIGGVAQVGQTLSVDPWGIEDGNGRLEYALFNYQWATSDGTADTYIRGSGRRDTYIVRDQDVGRTIKVVVYYRDPAGHVEMVTSTATPPVKATAADAPRNVSVSSGRTQELDVSWEAPLSHGDTPVQKYRVRWKEAANSWETETDVSEADETGASHTITGLTDGVSYSVRVVAVYENDEEGTPSAEITETSVTAIGVNLELRESHLLDYRTTLSQAASTTVEATLWAEGFTPTSSIVTIDAGATSSEWFTMTPVPTGDPNISGHLGMKSAEFRGSDSTEGYRLEPTTRYKSFGVVVRPPQPPSALSVSTGDTQLSVSWGEPRAGQYTHITGYRVQWKEESGDWETPDDVTEMFSTSTSHTITGLTNGVPYTVRVIARNNSGVGDSVPSGEITATPGSSEQTAATSTHTLRVSGAASTEYEENGTTTVATYGATGSTSTVTWSLTGDDSGDFSISNSGELTFSSPPDYESPSDSDSDNVYNVTINASDGTNTGTLDVTVTVTDQVEPPIGGL